ncbi:2-polyprenyl-6-methoxyphenol hydroxylase-like FAD-dependent oxidoreductase [Asanoa ferruginea]|uniref:2-polyprenyl-6-methoxyphenol hydroxylase-like FAD-dependent oxidoreductase n=1 Tax=Asanoa ferruginea TaxID=53367 RepID=A0A3D9ZJ56_9ACTN|nr:FAD-dependent monooxygenase [Asanoa ferruginea]REF95933.1 2-polyprenyl-6-methoxyphenol hydroxylase-like FAD-dependent oxidoreductase [Asanoa ferruginea]GIF50690.1 oxidoreductase [Asanoa ferruginea]
MTSVLISGAGVAGPTLAYWLARHGFEATVVERGAAPRSSGNPVDVRGPGWAVANRMGIVPQLRAAATQATAMRLVDAGGRTRARIPMPATRGSEVELPRGDLAALLFDAARGDAEFVWDDTITALAPDASGVDVTFERTAPRRFDFVVGADGLHSTVRRLAFGPEADFVRYLGLYVATLALGSDEGTDVILHNTPGRLLSIHPARGAALAAFIFRSAPVSGFDHRDLSQHKQIVRQAYAGVGWRVPELLDRVAAADDLYFDSVSEVRLDSWSRGRIGLLGDAASCVSLFGDGSSMAMAGAETLAAALAADPVEGFARYEAAHRQLVGPKQRRVGRAAGMLVPKTRLGLAARDLAARAVLARG